MSATNRRAVQAMVWQRLLNGVDAVVKSYRSDLEYDQRMINAEAPLVPFLHFARPSGTHLVFMRPADHEIWPEAGAQVPYLFSTADRLHILRETRILVACCLRYPMMHHWDGKQLHRINAEQAAKIAGQYVEQVEREWSK